MRTNDVSQSVITALQVNQAKFRRWLEESALICYVPGMKVHIVHKCVQCVQSIPVVSVTDVFEVEFRHHVHMRYCDNLSWSGRLTEDLRRNTCACVCLSTHRAVYSKQSFPKTVIKMGHFSLSSIRFLRIQAKIHYSTWMLLHCFKQIILSICCKCIYMKLTSLEDECVLICFSCAASSWLRKLL